MILSALLYLASPWAYALTGLATAPVALWLVRSELRPADVRR